VVDERWLARTAGFAGDEANGIYAADEELISLTYAHRLCDKRSVPYSAMPLQK
jgi:hypothetical protein